MAYVTIIQRAADTVARQAPTPSVQLEACTKAHDAEQSRTADEDEACFDSVR